MKDNIAIVGSPKKSIKVAHIVGAGLGNDVGMLTETANEVMRNELRNRRELLSEIALSYVGENYIADVKQYSSKQMKKMSKGFALIYRYVEPLDLSRFRNGFKMPSQTEMKRIVTSLNSLTQSHVFTQLNFKDVNTDYFKLTLCMLIILKSISAKYAASKNRNMELHTQFNLVAADFAERLYSMYVDDRMSSVGEDPNLICR